MTQLYSLNGQTPGELPPFLIVNGLDYSGHDRFIVAEHLGYTPAHDKPSYDPATQLAPVWNGATWDDPEDRTQESIDAEIAAELTAHKAEALVRIDDEAEAARLLFLTRGSGQALEYERTRAEAHLAQTLTDEHLTAEAFPWLEAERAALSEVGVAVTLREVEVIVNQQSAEWNYVGSAIKAIRRGAKLRVDAATDKAAVDAVFPITWSGV